MSEFKYHASSTIVRDVPFFKKKFASFMNVLPFGCCFLFTGETISYYSSISKNLFTLSRKYTDTFLARW